MALTLISYSERRKMSIVAALRRGVSGLSDAQATFTAGETAQKSGTGFSKKPVPRTTSWKKKRNLQIACLSADGAGAGFWGSAGCSFFTWPFSNRRSNIS